MLFINKIVFLTLEQIFSEPSGFFLIDIKFIYSVFLFKFLLYILVLLAFRNIYLKFFRN